MSGRTEIPPGFAAAMEYLKGSSTTTGDIDLTFTISDAVDLPLFPTDFENIKLIRRSDLIKAMLDDEDEMVVAKIKHGAASDEDRLVRKTLVAYCVPKEWRQLEETGRTKKTAPPPRHTGRYLHDILVMSISIYLTVMMLYWMLHWYIRLWGGPEMHIWLCDLTEAVLERLVGQGYAVQVRYSKY
ncbi:hypothetical protein H2200_009696 [Cladophialophora chaetospira]|uniref:Uncharacterized protein n=1 Tax=Cladophialophora chaetospira TaxID=386627 RepID=A0AA38X316_9EURO|nr:hypothetical protein H2200_009696 [Cladophialophora chaetospira]